MNENNVVKNINSNISDITFDTDSLDEIINRYHRIYDTFFEIEELTRYLNKPNECDLYGGVLNDFLDFVRKEEDDLKEKVRYYNNLIDSIINVENSYTNEILDLELPKI